VWRNSEESLLFQRAPQRFRGLELFTVGLSGHDVGGLVVDEGEVISDEDVVGVVIGHHDVDDGAGQPQGIGGGALTTRYWVTT
jgi:hypothetical protein